MARSVRGVTTHLTMLYTTSAFGSSINYGVNGVFTGNQAYTVDSTPDPRRVPGNTVPFHLRLSNKDVDPENVLPGGDRYSMLVDWVTVQVKYPTDLS